MKLTLTAPEYTAIREILIKGNDLFAEGTERRFNHCAIKAAMPSFEEVEETMNTRGLTSLTQVVNVGDVKRARMEMFSGIPLTDEQANMLFGNVEEKRTYVFRRDYDGKLEVEMVISDVDNAAILDYYNKSIQTLEVLHEHRALLHAAVAMAKALATTLKSVGKRCEAIWGKPTNK